MEMDELYGESCDDRFAFIAGYTSGGAPYGTTWEEMGIDPSLPFSEKVSLLGSSEFDLSVKNIPEKNEDETEEAEYTDSKIFHRRSCLCYCINNT